MKKNIVVACLSALLAVGFSFLPIQSVKAESVTSGNFVDVSARSAELYNSVGDALNKTEPENSNWYLGKTLNINGTNYYQVGGDEYLSAKDSYTYQKRPEVIRVASDEGNIPVYDHNFVQSSEVALAPGTYWYSDQIITTPDGMPFARVATNEYVGMWQVTQQSFTEK